jgi:hypothetical protein
VISATVYQPGIAIVKNHPAIVEPDTLSYMGIACITNEGSPLDADLTAGTITIYRIRAGASTTIVSGAACALLTGNIYYAYTFPAASWQAGDMYRAQMSGQEVTVNGIVYPLAIISMEGRISREAVIEEDTDAIKVITDALTAAAAAKLALSAGTIVAGTVSHDNTAATTTVFYADDITEAIADHYNGRIVIFTSGALQYQATDITDYELESGEGKFTVTALTDPPADNVTFIIV